MKKVTTVIRILYGLAFTVFGLNMFLNFIPQPKTPMPEPVVAFNTALMNTGYMFQMIGVTMVVSGVLLLLNRFVPLALAFLAPFLVNSFLFHYNLEHTGLPMSAIFCAIELYLAWAYRAAFRSMLRAKVEPN